MKCECGHDMWVEVTNGTGAKYWVCEKCGEATGNKPPKENIRREGGE